MIYFNNAADSHPKLASVYDFLSKPFFAVTGRDCNCETSKDLKTIDNFREKVSEFLNLPKNYLVTITSGATESSNIIINSFSKIRSDNDYVIYDHSNHNSVLRPLHELYGEDKLEMHKNCFGSPNWFEIEKVNNIISKRNGLKPQLLIFSHQSNVTGSVLTNTEELIKFASDNDIPLILDMTQSIGNISIDISKLLEETQFNKLYIFGTTHKNLCSISGTGFLIHPQENNLVPLMFGGTGTQSLDFKQPKDYPHYLECGTYNIQSLQSANIALDYCKEFMSIHTQTKRDLVNYFIEKYTEINTPELQKYIILQPSFLNPDSGIINLLPISDELGKMISQFLFKEKFITRFGCHCSPKFKFRYNGHIYDQTIRISFNQFNTKTEIDEFIHVFDNLMSDIIIATNQPGF